MIKKKAASRIRLLLDKVYSNIIWLKQGKNTTFKS